MLVRKVPVKYKKTREEEISFKVQNPKIGRIQTRYNHGKQKSEILTRITGLINKIRIRLFTDCLNPIFPHIL